MPDRRQLHAAPAHDPAPRLLGVSHHGAVTPAEGPGPGDSLVDPVWEAVVELLLPLGPVTERRSRYGDKPALVVAGQREIAHCEAPGVVDVRITRRGWRRFGPTYDGDRRVQRRGSSDWVQLRLTVDDVEAMSDLLSAVVAANRS